MEASGHTCVGNPCIICALRGVFFDLGVAPNDNQGEPVSPYPLRLALSRSPSNLPEGEPVTPASLDRPSKFKEVNVTTEVKASFLFVYV